MNKTVLGLPPGYKPYEATHIQFTIDVNIALLHSSTFISLPSIHYYILHLTLRRLMLRDPQSPTLYAEGSFRAVLESVGLLRPSVYEYFIFVAVFRINRPIPVTGLDLHCVVVKLISVSSRIQMATDDLPCSPSFIE